MGFTELRFTNEEVRQDADEVIKKIKEELKRNVNPKTGSSKASLRGRVEGGLKVESLYHPPRYHLRC